MTAMDPDGQVGIGIVAVPDGFAGPDGVRISLVLSPVLDGADRMVALADWPQEVASLVAAGGLTMLLAGLDAQSAAVSVPLSAPGVRVSHPPPGGPATAALWHRIVSGARGAGLALAGADGGAMRRALLQQRDERETLMARLSNAPTPDGRREVRVLDSAPHALANVLQAVQVQHSLALLGGAPGTNGGTDGAWLLHSDVFRDREPATASSPPMLAERQSRMREALGYRYNQGEGIRLNQAPPPPGQPSPPGGAPSTAPSAGLSNVLTLAFIGALGQAFTVVSDQNSDVAGRLAAGSSPFQPLAPGTQPRPVLHAFLRTPSPSYAAEAAALLTPQTATSAFDPSRLSFALYRATRPLHDPQVIATPDTLAREAYGRRLAGVMANPTLAKFLGFIVDVEVPRDVLVHAGIGEFGLVAAVAGPVADAAAPGTRWSAFRLAGAPGPAGYFGPVSREVFADHARPGPAAPGTPLGAYRHVDGLQNLGFVAEDGTVRFSLQSLEADGLVQAVATASRSVSDQQAEGEHPRHIDTMMPPARTAGISLVDTMRRDRVVESLLRRSTGSRTDPLFSDDLAIGYRVDVGWRPARASAPRWRSVMERTVAFSGHDVGDRALTAFQNQLPPEERAREAGVLRTPVRINTFWADPLPGRTPPSPPPGTPPPEEAPAGQTTVPFVSSETPPSVSGRAPPADETLQDMPPPVFGHDPGLPRPVPTTTPPDAPPSRTPPTVPGVPPLQVAEAVAHQTMTTWRGWSLALPACGTAEVPVDEDVDLPLDLAFDIPAAAPPMWPLRFGRSYRLGVRLVWLNGSGVSRMQADAHYDSLPEVTLGGSADDRAHLAPDKGFLFHRAEPVGTPDVLLRPEGATDALSAGEQTTVVVVRSGLPGIDLGPAIATVSHRALVPPRVNEDLADLHGAFDRTPGKRPQGGLRDVRRPGPGGTFPTALDIHGDAPAKGAQRSVLAYEKGAHLGNGGGADGHDYWPDPLADALHYAFMRGDTPAPGYPPPGRVPFYAAGHGWPDVSAIHLRLRPAAPGELAPGTPGAVMARRPAAQQLRSMGKSVDATEGVLEVVLAPGQTVDMLLWAGTTVPEQLRQHSALPRMLAQYPAAVDGPSELVASDRLAHAVSLMGRLVNDLVPSGPAASAAADAAALLGYQALPILSASTRVTLIHAVPQPLPLPGTGASGAGGPVLRESAFVRRVAAGTGWDADQKDATRLFVRGRVLLSRPSTAAVELRATWTEYDDPSGSAQPSKRPMSATVRLDTPDRDADPLEPLDILRDDRQRPREPAFDLPDKRARRLTITPVALTRFAKLFAAPASPTQTPFERPGPALADVWAKATARPAAPELSSLGPTLVLEHLRTGPDAERRFTVRHATVVRIHLERGWFSSGEGEMLAVIFARPGQDVEQLPPDQAGLAPFLSRWGADPTRLGPVVPGAGLPPERVSGAATPLLAYDLPLPGEPGQPLAAARVDVLGFKPSFDQAAGAWRVDVTIDGAGSPEMFAWLGLARLQVNAATGLELSLPTTTWVNGIKPSRTVNMQVDAAGRTVTVEILGSATWQTSTQIPDKPPVPGVVEQATGLVIATGAPIMSVRLMREAEHVAYGPQGHPDTGVPVEQHLAAAPQEQVSRWFVKLDLPTRWDAARYTVDIQEREWLAMDDRAAGGTLLGERGSPFYASVGLAPVRAPAAPDGTGHPLPKDTGE